MILKNYIYWWMSHESYEKVKELASCIRTNSRLFMEFSFKLSMTKRTGSGSRVLAELEDFVLSILSNYKNSDYEYNICLLDQVYALNSPFSEGVTIQNDFERRYGGYDGVDYDNLNRYMDKNGSITLVIRLIPRRKYLIPFFTNRNILTRIDYITKLYMDKSPEIKENGSYFWGLGTVPWIKKKLSESDFNEITKRQSTIIVNIPGYYLNEFDFTQLKIKQKIVVFKDYLAISTHLQYSLQNIYVTTIICTKDKQIIEIYISEKPVIITKLIDIKKLLTNKK